MVDSCDNPVERRPIVLTPPTTQPRGVKRSAPVGVIDQCEAEDDPDYEDEGDDEYDMDEPDIEDLVQESVEYLSAPEDGLQDSDEEPEDAVRREIVANTSSHRHPKICFMPTCLTHAEILKYAQDSFDMYERSKPTLRDFQYFFIGISEFARHQLSSSAPPPLIPDEVSMEWDRLSESASPFSVLPPLRPC